MIKFSWKKINNKFDWNAQSVIEYFYLRQEIDLPKFIHRKVPKLVKREAMYLYPQGPCFIVNPDIALQKAEEPLQLYTYLELASKRNIFDYLVRGVVHLPLMLVPEYQLEWVELSPIMKIENDKVLFKYEQEIKQYGY